jgi:hypothetical protein
MVNVVFISEIDDNHARFRLGNGRLDLYENMPDDLIAQLIKRAAVKSEGMPFTVRMLPDWNTESQ